MMFLSTICLVPYVQSDFTCNLGPLYLLIACKTSIGPGQKTTKDKSDLLVHKKWNGSKHFRYYLLLLTGHDYLQRDYLDQIILYSRPWGVFGSDED